MGIQERIILYFSKDPKKKDSESGQCKWSSDNALSLLKREYPDFGDLVFGKRVIDFGCGTGCQSIALVQNYDCYVIGVDLNQKTLNSAVINANRSNIPNSKLIFTNKIPEFMLSNTDLVISQNSFEHFANPAKILQDMRCLINYTGKILITFGPPWLAPYGSHMHFFCKLPWINVLFSEKAVMNVRSRFLSDGAGRYEEVESGLNKMTVSKFENIVRESGLKIEYKNYSAIKGIGVLSKIPFAREFFINHISVILGNNLHL